MNIFSHFIVVDDDHMSNIVCKYMIARDIPSATIELFTDPEKGLIWIQEKYGNNSVGATVLFLDINMQTMSGWEFLDEFRLLPEEIQKQIKIYMLSSSIDNEDKNMADKHPLVQGFYSKPLSKETLSQIHQ